MITVVYKCNRCEGETSAIVLDNSDLRVWEIGYRLKIKHHQEKDVFDKVRCPEKPNE